ncbi:MAG: hypothetical protein LBU39_05730 [Desulfobulbaceae bacterium]|jgi:hypothetical protein|nr:hypothetical protein [Desulfobulbaceae bacterium]
MNAIVPAQPAAVIAVVSSETATTGGRNAQPLNLEAGQILRATVLDTPTRGQALLAFGDTQLLAETALSLRPGQTLSLRLVATEPRMLFSLADSAAALPQLIGKNVAVADKSMTVANLFALPRQADAGVALAGKEYSVAEFLGLLRQTEANVAPPILAQNVALAGKEYSVAEFLGLLRQTEANVAPQASMSGSAANLPGLSWLAESPLLANLSEASRQTLFNYLRWQQTPLESQSGGRVLRQLIEHLGLHMERNLAEGRPEAAKATLKAALLEFAQQSGAASEESKSVAQAKNMLSTLEMFQLAQAQLAAGKEQIYPLPLPFLETGYLRIEEDAATERRDEAEGGAVTTFSLLLSLTGLGFLRIDFVKSQEGLALRFHAASQEKADFAAAYADDLRAAMKDVSVISLSFAADAQDPIKELLRDILPENSGLLNTTA